MISTITEFETNNAELKERERSGIRAHSEMRKRPKNSSSAAKNSKRSKIIKESDPLALYFKQISRFPLLTI